MTKKAKTTLSNRNSFAFCLFKFEGEVYLFLADDGQGATVRGWKTVEDGLLYFSDVYHNASYLNFTASGSAAIYQMTFQPSLCRARNGKWLQDNVIAESRDVLQIGRTWRYLVGATRPEALALWIAGQKPNLEGIR